MSKSITFLCSIPPIQNALKFGGKVGRVTFEIPESELQAAVGLIALQETPLKVTVEVDNGTGQNKDNSEDSEAGAENRNARPWLRKLAAKQADG